MKILTKSALTGFAMVTTIQFIGILIYRVYGFVRWGVGGGPCALSEIQWLKEILVSIIIGLISGWIIGKSEYAKKAKGMETIDLCINFKNFAVAILTFTVLFFGVMFLFVIREYYEYISGISYMFRKTFWQYCGTQIPWLEILVTSLIFGIILSIGFSKIEKEKS